MATSIVWISGASSGIGQALAATVPWEDARVIDISRRGAAGLEHLQADLSDPASWPLVTESFQRELSSFSGERAVFIHSSGTLEPIGFAGEVNSEAYARNVVLNSAAPQVLGHGFLAAAKDPDAECHLMDLTSGAATAVYPGWSSYGAGKAAVDEWVRSVGAEQARRGGVRVMAVAPGVVGTPMQEQIRNTAEEDFPSREKFVGLFEEGKLREPQDVARKLWSLLDRDLENGAVLDLRNLE